MWITCHNNMVCNLESHAITIKCCFGMRQPHVQCFLYWQAVFCRRKLTKGATPWKWILPIFKCKSELSKQLGLEKQMKKMGSFVWFSCLRPKWWSLNCQKLWPFCKFDASKTSKAVIAIFVYTSESCFVFLENGIGCCAMT